jgi:alkylation response protein AidB-like acyl-CoA dehydrogenase
MPTTNRSTVTGDVPDVDALLTADLLSALMRSTWTWDDRALRRDLSELLVRVDAARLVGANGHAPDHVIASALRSEARAVASGFVATVLGPKLVADTGNPLRSQFLSLATDPAHFGKRAHVAREAVGAGIDGYFATHVDGIDYASEADWSKLVTKEGTTGLGAATRAYGHALADSAFFANRALAWQAASAVPRCDIAAGYAARIQADDLTATLAAAEETGAWDPVLVKTRAKHTTDGWTISGHKHFVPGANSADVIFVIARSTAGPSLFAVETGTAGLTVNAHDVIDPTRPLFGVTFDNTPATLLGTEGSGGKLMWTLIDRASTALAGEQVCLIERAIGVLRDADNRDDHRVVEVVLAHAAAHALWQRAIADASPESAAAAHVGCSGAAVRVATAVAEMCDDDSVTTQLVLRALSGSLLFGGPALSHERLLDRLGI